MSASQGAAVRGGRTAPALDEATYLISTFEPCIDVA